MAHRQARLRWMWQQLWTQRRGAPGLLWALPSEETEAHVQHGRLWAEFEFVEESWGAGTDLDGVASMRDTWGRRALRTNSSASKWLLYQLYKWPGKWLL